MCLHCFLYLTLWAAHSMVSPIPNLEFRRFNFLNYLDCFEKNGYKNLLKTAMQFELVSFNLWSDEFFNPESRNSWNHVMNISLESFSNIYRKICRNYTAMQFEFDSFMSCCDDSSNPKSLITAWFSLFFFFAAPRCTVI